ncbi:hypothetical protein B0H10DRAFT_1386297 [Mycena sp. CBHHK59/15]|nr:hypothetical protein B0H10DRAFT_1386297 [Mycena sp. CBHHK59/15]
MVAPGGPALDDDEEEHVEKPQKGKTKKGMPNAVSALFRSIRIADDASTSHRHQARRPQGAHWKGCARRRRQLDPQAPSSRYCGKIHQRSCPTRPRASRCRFTAPVCTSWALKTCGSVSSATACMTGTTASARTLRRAPSCSSPPMTARTRRKRRRTRRSRWMVIFRLSMAPWPILLCLPALAPPFANSASKPPLESPNLSSGRCGRTRRVIRWPLCIMRLVGSERISRWLHGRK